MADPTGYAHAANLTGADDLAMTLAGQLREAQEAIQRVRVWAEDVDRAEMYSDAGTRGGYRDAQFHVLAALDPPDGAA